MSDPNSIELLSSSDGEQEEKKCEEEVEVTKTDHVGGKRKLKMGNCIGGGGGGTAKRRRPPSTSRTGSPPPRISSRSRQQSSPVTRKPSSPPAKRRPGDASPPDVEYVPNGGGNGVERHRGSPPRKSLRNEGVGQSAASGRAEARQEAAKKAAAAAEAAEKRRKATEKPFIPLYVASSSSSSSSSASSSASSFFSTINCSSNHAVRAPPPKYNNDAKSSQSKYSTAATTGASTSFGSFSNCASAAAVRGSNAASNSVSPSRSSHTARPRRHSAKEGLRPLTIDLTELCGDEIDNGKRGEQTKGGKGKQANGKKQHHFSESAGLTAVAHGVELVIGERVGKDENSAAYEDKSAGKKRPKPSSLTSRIDPPAPPDDGPAVYEEDDETDVAVITEGIMGLIDGIGIPNAATCTSPAPIHSANANPNESSSVFSFPRPSPLLPLHYQQRDKWSCGFRNMQMVLSALLPRMRADHRYFSMDNGQTGPRQRRGSGGGSGGVNRRVPTLYHLQSYLEHSWSDGFDPRGARHFGHRIRGRTGRSSWIGAVEVSSLLSYFGVDSAVVQFIQTPKSRALLGDFVRSYFERKVGYDGCYACCSALSFGPTAMKTVSPLSSTQVASELMQFAAMRKSAGDGNSDVAVECCRCPVPPLYLQWEGHSVTVVGCSEQKGFSNFGGGVRGGSYDLLVFDPMRSGSAIKERLQNGIGGLATSGKGTNFSLTNPQIGVILPTTDLTKLDCQIVLSSQRPLSNNERAKYRAKVSALTAADNDTKEYSH